MKLGKFGTAVLALALAPLAASAQTVKIGLILTMSGPNASIGDLMDKAVRLYVKQLEKELPPGYRFDVGGGQQEMNEMLGAAGAALGLAVIFIYIVLASQFGSFVQPIAIMASLPLALIGVMIALLLWKTTLNIFSMIGLVMLMGLVTKNAILLVDFTNHLRKDQSLSVPEALLQAGLIRMRPIIMTTAAMVFGMLPMAIALNEGGEIQAPMGRAIIGGVITSTILTLVVVPVIYSYLVRGRKVFSAADADAMPDTTPDEQDHGRQSVMPVTPTPGIAD